MADYLKIIEDFEKEQAAKRRCRFTWQDFYPDLDPSEWVITEMESGVKGHKVSGPLAGTVAFFIPVERLESGPVRRSRR